MSGITPRLLSQSKIFQEAQKSDDDRLDVIEEALKNIGTAPEPTVFSTVAALKAGKTPINCVSLDASAGAAAGTFFYQTGDFTGKADDVTIIKRFEVTLSTGAWIRQQSASITFTAVQTGAKPRPITDVLSDVISAKNFGMVEAVGPNNGQSDALQTAINRGGAYSVGLSRSTHIPSGIFYQNTTLIPQDYSRITGDGPRASVLYNEQNPLNAPAFKTSGASFGFSRFENFGIRGFSTGFRIEGDTDGLRFKSLHLLRCNTAFDFTNYLQTTVFDDIEVDQGSIGILSRSTVANRVTVRDCDFKNMSDSAIYLFGAEDFLCEGSRFEGGGLVGKSTLNLANIRSASFVGGYMESTHENAARYVASPGGVLTFSNFHFTGTGAKNSDLSYNWLTDGTGDLIFHNTHTHYPMRVPAHATFEGSNPGLIPAIWAGRASARQRRPQAAEFALVRFTRLNTSADAGNYTDCTGYITLNIAYLAPDGVTYSAVRRMIRVRAVGRGGALFLKAETINNDDEGIGLNAVYTTLVQNPQTGVINIRLEGSDPAAAPVFLADWSIWWNQTDSLDSKNLFSVELQ